jgi:hypothetical protein
MSAVYAYARDGGPKPKELEWMQLIDRFGAQAVLGRALGAGEMRRGMLAEAVYRAYRGYTAAADRAKWESENPEAYKLYLTAMKLANGETLDE